MSNRSKRYTQEFKLKIIELYKNGKSAMELAKEYDIGRPTVSKWISDYSKTKSFKAKDNRNDEENELT